MSWFKKVFGRSKEDHLESEEPFNKEKEKTINIPNEKNKDMEARISYHYPKGEFRFPVIPDKREQRREDRPSRAEQRRDRREHRHEEKREPVQEEASKDISRKKEKSPAKEEAFKRPFRPTEIPSPIYGFSKPAKKEPVQFELKSSVKRHWGETEQRRDAEAETPKMEEIERPLTPELDNAAALEETELVHSQETSSVEAEPGEKMFEENLESDSLEVEGSDLEESKVVEEKPVIGTSDSSPILETEEGDISPAPSLSAAQESSQLSEEEGWAANPQPVSVIEEEQSTEVTEEGMSKESVPSHPQQTRSHLPFNVLMLKQDKRKMERNKRLAELEEKSLKTIYKEDQVQNKSEEDDSPEPVAEKPITTEKVNEENTTSETGEDSSVISSEKQQEAEESEEPAAYLNTAEEPVSEDEQPQDEPEQPQASSRSHLPFNVLMLKQDKRKMAGGTVAANTSAATSAKSVSYSPKENQNDDSIKNYEALTSESDQDEDYFFPKVNYLAPPVMKESSGEWLQSQRNLLDDTLANFNVRAKVVNVTEGPSVTRFEVQPEPGVKVNKITNLADDIKLSLAARDIRIEAPIPGKHTIGIEVPNKQSRPVALSEIISSSQFQDSGSPLTAALGLDISGDPIVTDLNKMPHGLIAGATGSGKSVCINSILISLLYKASPQDLKLLLIDPKMVELAPYNRMPHLVSPVITDVKAATAALKWAVEEMERRYELFAHTGVRDISRYNLKAERNGEKNQKLPYLVIVIDELADLMMMSPADVEEAICRIAQKARACGIHLIIATQRPSVDVITGLIKANVPTRIAFSVSSGVDSRTIIDSSGAEKLLGKGDMLFLENGSSKPVRLQGTFVSDDEIDEIVNHVREQGEPDYLFQQDELLKKAQVDEQEDELFFEACGFVVEQGGASTSLIQRHFRVGYNRAARLIDMMESHGFVSEAKGSKPRDVLISARELQELQETSTII